MLHRLKVLQHRALANNEQLKNLYINFLYLNMETQELTPNSLNEQQLMMLRLLKKPMPEGDFIQIRRLAVKLLSRQVDETIEEWEAKNDISAKDYEQQSKKHFRSSSSK